VCFAGVARLRGRGRNQTRPDHVLLADNGLRRGSKMAWYILTRFVAFCGLTLLSTVVLALPYLA